MTRVQRPPHLREAFFVACTLSLTESIVRLRQGGVAYHKALDTTSFTEPRSQFDVYDRDIHMFTYVTNEERQLPRKTGGKRNRICLTPTEI